MRNIIKKNLIYLRDVIAKPEARNIISLQQQ